MHSKAIYRSKNACMHVWLLSVRVLVANHVLVIYIYNAIIVMISFVRTTVRGKILEWEKIGEFGELWSLRQYFTRQ